MDVIDAMSAGAAGGLLGLLSAMLIAPFVRPAAPSAGAPADSYAIRTTQIVLTLLAAAMLGALYWLSWGLAAVVNVPWWFRGITFALVCFAALPLPALLTLLTRVAIDRRVLIGSLLHWLLVCLGAGLTSAWVAMRSP